MNKEQVLGLIRHTLTFVGGLIVANGIISESMTADAVGAVMTLIGVIWSAVSNK
jgi:hypothetical protein